jgi:hypothetical protein
MNYMPMKLPKKLYKYVTVLFLITFCLRVVLVSYHNNNFGGIEPNVVYGIQRILLGQPLYQDPAAGSYGVIQYTPLHYYFVAGIAKLTGIDGLNVQGVYMLCRALALFFNLLTVIVCALIIRSWRFSWAHCFVFAMPVLIMLTSHYYTRGDSMHLFFFTAAIYSYLLYSKSGAMRHVFVAALFSAACIMVKQSGVLLFGITGFCLLFIERRFWATVLYSLCTIIFVYAIARACIGNNNWHAFYQNAYLGLKNGISMRFLAEMFISQFFMEIVPCYILGGIMVWLAYKKIPDKTFSIMATGAALSWLFAVITGLKIGSSNNYFIEFLFFLVVALPYLLQNEIGEKVLGRPFGRTLTIHRFAYIAFFILITSKTLGLFSAVVIERGLKDSADAYANDENLYRYFTQTLHIQDSEKIFFTERHFLDNMFIEHAIIPNKDVVSQLYASNSGTFDYSGFILGMNNGMIKYIVTDEKKNDINEYNKELPFILFDKTKFRLIATNSGYSIYVYSPGVVSVS